MNLQRKTTDLIAKIAKKNSVSFTDAERVVASIFDSTANAISETTSNAVYLRYLGTFGGKKSRAEAIELAKNKK